MKKLLILVAAAVLAICFLVGCVEIETYTDSGQAIDIGLGQDFYIALGSNPGSTGYSWQASYDESMLELVGGESEYKPAEGAEGMVGAGGTEIFHFHALAKGETEITLTYRQPWDGGGIGETKVFTVNID